MNNWIKKAQFVVFPPVCLLCGVTAGGANGDASLLGMDLCAACHADLPRIIHACRQCALPVDAATENAVCGQCLQQPPPFNRSVSLFRYQPPVDSLIQQLKFNSRLPNARLLGHLLAHSVRDLPQRPQALLPVPLHKSRMRERGFNQALEIARPVARSLGLPLLTQTCKRTRPTPSQTELSADQRRKNVKGIFEVTQPIDVSHVVIIDDVMTTGQTVGELAKTLRKAGVQQVDVWVCARAELL